MFLSHRLRFMIVTFLAVTSVIACGGSSSPSAREPVASGDANCPVAVPGTSATVEDTDSGAALVFVSTGDVAELRKRAAAMAKMHNDHHSSMGPLPDGSEGGGGGHDMSKMGADSSNHDMSKMGSASSGHDMSKMGSGSAMMIGIHAKATVADIEGGARIVFTAAGPDVAKLQSELRMHAQHLASGSCSMGAK